MMYDENIMGKIIQFPYRNRVFQNVSYGPIAEDLYEEASSIDEKDPEMAKALYEEAIRIDPEHGRSWNNLGNIYFHQNNIEEAKWCYLKALVSDPENIPEALYNMGYLAMNAQTTTLRAEKENLLHAISLFQKAIQSYPMFADAHYNLALAMTWLAKNEGCKKLVWKARMYWSQCLKIEPYSEWSSVAKWYMKAVTI